MSKGSEGFLNWDLRRPCGIHWRNENKHWQRRNFTKRTDVLLLTATIFLLTINQLLPFYHGRASRGSHPACKWKYDRLAGGYPAVACKGQLSHYVCPSMFRDLSDFVFAWPFEHFHEDVNVAIEAVALANLPPVPIIYSHANQAVSGELGGFLKQTLKKPYILITGQSDYGIPSTRHTYEIAEDPNLVHWFAQNNEITHPKITPIPIGLNCFEHGEDMDLFLSTSRRKEMVKENMLLVNFGLTHPSRVQVWDHFCSTNSSTTCLPKESGGDGSGTSPLLRFYKEFASFKFVICPRGNGIDTHRVWEALYLGVIPILEHSALDPLFTDLPVILVDSFLNVTVQSLEKEYLRIQDDKRTLPGKLHREHWWAVIEKKREEALQAFTIEDAATRSRCWGPA